MGKADRQRARSLSWRILKGEWRELRQRTLLDPPTVVPAHRVDAGAVAVVRAPSRTGGERYVMAVDAVATASGRTVVHDLSGYRLVVHPDEPVRVVSEAQRERWGRASSQLISMLSHYVEPYGCRLRHVVFGARVARGDAGRRDLTEHARLLAVAAGPADRPPVIDLRRDWGTLADLSLEKAEVVTVMPCPVRLDDMQSAMEVGQHLSRHLRARVGEPRG